MRSFIPSRLCSLIPSFLHPVMKVCLRECVNALMRIKRWIWGSGFRIGAGRMEGWVGVAPLDPPGAGFSDWQGWKNGRLDRGQDWGY